MVKKVHSDFGGARHRILVLELCHPDNLLAPSTFGLVLEASNQVINHFGAFDLLLHFFGVGWVFQMLSFTMDLPASSH